MIINKYPLVTVVIPTFNSSSFINRAIDSVINQTYKNWEIIVVDNYSTDGTHSAVKDINDLRIRFFSIKNGGVIAKSRNFGVRNSKGEWIAFLDADDWWAPEKLGECIKLIDDNVDIIYHKCELIKNKKYSLRKKYIKSWEMKTPKFLELIVKGNPIVTSSVLVRRKIIEHINYMNESVEMVGAEDYNTWLRISRVTENFSYISTNLGYYLSHAHSVSQKDMSNPIKSATMEFIGDLGEYQKNILNARIEYKKGRYNFQIGNYDVAKKSLLFAIKNGEKTIYIKSIVLLLAAHLNLLKNQLGKK